MNKSKIICKKTKTILNFCQEGSKEPEVYHCIEDDSVAPRGASEPPPLHVKESFVDNPKHNIITRQRLKLKIKFVWELFQIVV